MLLGIDAGNTNMVFAVYRESEILTSWRCNTVAGKTADEYAAWLQFLFEGEGISFEEISSVLISSVVPDLNFDLKVLAEKYFFAKAHFIRNGDVETGVFVEMENPQEVGADRIVNCAAVKAYYSTPAIVIDFGTATTFDVIGTNGHYLGGIIAPGINLSLKALHNATAQLPLIHIQEPKQTKERNSIIGKNTVQAMQAGIYWGNISMIEGLVNKISDELDENQKPEIIATGGLSNLFAKRLQFIDHVDNDLTLKGLAAIYALNKEKFRQ